jgi:hypothetical protein
MLIYSVNLGTKTKILLEYKASTFGDKITILNLF